MPRIAFGGAVYTTGDSTLNDCTVSNNSAEGGAGWASGYGRTAYTGGNAWGGGVYVGLGTVHINASSIEENSASGGNGGEPPDDYPASGGRRQRLRGRAPITNQAQGWVSQTLISGNSALAGSGGGGTSGSGTRASLL